jgi:cytochrome b6-f complex iron-sulfur subunit
MSKEIPPKAKPAAKAESAAKAKPAAKGRKAGQKVDGNRRSFLSWMSLAWVSFTASVVAGGAATTRFMFPNVLFEPPSTFRAGRPEELQLGVVDERFKDANGVWLVREEDGIYALSTTCTHLGCTPNWLSAEGKFKCPCHGSGFYIDGVNFEGPAPRPLERFNIGLAENGEIVVDKGQKYQQEKGEWELPGAFLEF